MRNIQKRSISLLVVLALCLSFIVPAVQTPAAAATVTYEYDGDHIYNWGTRGELATFMSPKAETFYTGDNTYEVWSQLSGSATTADVPNSELYIALGAFMKEQHTKTTSYDATRELFALTDCQNNGDPATISSFYSGAAIGPDWDSGTTWNREHTWPDSKSDSRSGKNGETTIRETDIMMLRPTATSENSSRGNTPYGESAAYYDPNNESRDYYNLHGDVARILLYVYTRWGYDAANADGALDYMWGSNGVIESVDVLLKWMEEDPVDTWELGRNDSVQSITGTRNVFVDYPQLAFLLFNEEVPADLQSPSAVGESVAVTYKQNGVTVSTVNANTNTYVTLPAHSGNVAEDYSFVGWVTETISGSVETAPTYYAAGASCKITGATTFHALYTTGGSTGAANVYEKVTSEPADWSGDYLIVYEDGNVAFDGSLTKLDATNNTKTVTINEYTIEKNATTEAFQFTIAAVDGGYSIQSASGLYIGSTANSNELKSSETTVYVNELAVGTNGTVVGGTSTTLRFNDTSNQMRFRYYKSGQKPVALYKAAESANKTAYVTTTCAHTNYTNVTANAATCDAPGNTAGKLCGDCGNYFDGYTVIAATGHDWDEGVVTEPTATEQGFTLYSCQNAGCDETYKDNYEDPLGLPYTVTFVVPEGVTAIAERTVNANDGTTLPTAEVPTGDVEYTFHGWAESTCDNVTEAPTVKTGKFYPTKNVTLYAVYTYTVGGGTASGDYVLTDLADIGAADNVVITMTKEGTTWAMSNNNGTVIPPAAVVVTVSGDKLTGTIAENIQWNISNNNDNLTIYPNGTTDKWLYCTNANKGVWVGTGDANTFVIDETTGYLKNPNTTETRYIGVYNGQDWRCYTNTTGNTAGQTLGFYVQPAGGTAYYTTVIGSVPVTPPANQYTVSFAVPAGVAAVAAQTVTEGKSVDLPTAGVPTGEHTYTFKGWAEAAVTEETEDAPTWYTGSYKPTADITLYPVYAYDVFDENETATTWQLVASTSDLAAEDRVVFACKEKNAVAGDMGSNTYMPSIATTFASDKITILPDDALIVTVGKSGSNWTFANSSNELLRDTGASKSQKLSWSSGTTTWTVTIDSDGNATVANSDVTTNKLLYNANQPRFKTYSSSQTAIQLYKEVVSGGATKTYYTSANAVAAPTADDIFFAINFGSSMAMHVYIPAETLNRYDSASVVLKTDKDGTAVEPTSGNATVIDNVSYMEYVYGGLTILDIAETVNVELTVTKNGQNYTANDQKSILDFCNTAVTDSTPDAEPCAFLMQYAQAAAAYLNKEAFEVSAAAQTVIENSDLKSVMPGMELSEKQESDQIKFLGQSLDMTARIKINYHIDLSNYTGNKEDLVFEINGDPYTFDKLVEQKDGSYVLSYSDFNATEMSVDAKCVVKDQEVWYETSIERYCRSVLENENETATMRTLAECIYRYGAACAKIYGQNQ